MLNATEYDHILKKQYILKFKELKN